MNKYTGLLAALLLTAATPAIAEDDPVTLVETTANKILDDVNANREAYTADPSGLRAVVREDLVPMFDVPFTARLIAGRAGRGLPPEKFDELGDAMLTQLIDRYTEGLLQFKDEQQLEVLPLRGELNERQTPVNTRVVLPNGEFVPITYVFRKTDAGWRVFDVTVEGISYVTTFRNQISPRIADEGIDAVIAQLRAGQLELNDA